MNYFYIGLLLIIAIVLVSAIVVFIYLVDELGKRRNKEDRPENPDVGVQETFEEIVTEEKRLASFDEWLKERDENTDEH